MELSRNSFLLPCTETKRFFVILKVGVMPGWGEHAGFHLGVCNLNSFLPGSQWLLEAVMMFECNSDKREVREFNIVAV